MILKNSLFRVYCDTLEEVQECVEDADFIRPLLIEGARRLMKTRRAELIIAEILSLDTYAVIRISIKRDEVLEVLDKTLQWFLSREEYEECGELKELIDKWRAREEKAAQRRSGRQRSDSTESDDTGA